MNIKDAICPKCGQISKDGAVCERCSSVSSQWVTIPDRFFITLCPSCGAFKTASHWEDLTNDPVEFARNQLIHQIFFAKNVKDPEISSQIFMRRVQTAGHSPVLPAGPFIIIKRKNHFGRQ